MSKLMIAVEDSIVLVDSDARVINLSSLDGIVAPLIAPALLPPFVVHAVHWDSVTGKGEIELIVPPVNVPVDDTNAFQSIVALWNANPPVPDVIPPPTREELVEGVRQEAVRVIQLEQLEARLLDPDTPQEVLDWDAARELLP